MTILYVCYGKKDTDELLSVADKIKKEKGQPFFLVLGSEADVILRKRKEEQTEYYLPTKYFFLKDLLNVNDYPNRVLTQDELKMVHDKLNSLEILYALIGVSDAEVLFQVARLIPAHSLQSGVMLCEVDLITDEHVLVKTLQSEDSSWLRIFKLLVGNSSHKRQLINANDSVLCCTIHDELSFLNGGVKDETSNSKRLVGSEPLETLPLLFRARESQIKRRDSLSEIVAQVLIHKNKKTG